MARGGVDRSAPQVDRVPEGGLGGVGHHRAHRELEAGNGGLPVGVEGGFEHGPAQLGGHEHVVARHMGQARTLGTSGTGAAGDTTPDWADAHDVERPYVRGPAAATTGVATTRGGAGGSTESGCGSRGAVDRP